ncbi:helix-turn-helix domain-containing protein [Ancylobacter pratisalsi]|uniref:Helix-turn-helix domain-containing protein n=1 Tax=Ancylobacter pratisalsi TaxID=1745854 RepID=A0A6P1YTU6_9HYPH|nr:helix-turn-helix domain-containing protein [Ancylobacter pratisalsi]QIB36552.1 helix-turn-helix domain-containing protein [Ancylobacter pratisalsi]
MKTDEDLIDGLSGIALYLGWSKNRVKHACRDHGLPVFRIGRRVFARKSTITRWLSDLEATISPSNVAPNQPEGGKQLDMFDGSDADG